MFIKLYYYRLLLWWRIKNRRNFLDKPQASLWQDLKIALRVRL